MNNVSRVNSLLVNSSNTLLTLSIHCKVWVRSAMMFTWSGMRLGSRNLSCLALVIAYLTSPICCVYSAWISQRIDLFPIFYHLHLGLPYICLLCTLQHFAVQTEGWLSCHIWWQTLQSYFVFLYQSDLLLLPGESTISLYQTFIERKHHHHHWKGSWIRETI